MAGSKFSIEFIPVTERLEHSIRRVAGQTTGLTRDFRRLDRASLEVRDATLKVERAQISAARAADRYGKESLQAASAQVRLERAQERLSRASDRQGKRMGVLAAGFGKAAKAAAGLAAAYLSVSGIKSAISTTEELGKQTLTLSKSFGLTVHAASQWAAVSKARGTDGRQLVMGFKQLATQVRNARLGIRDQSTALDELRKKNDVALARAVQDAARSRDQVAAQRTLTRARRDAALAEADLTGRVATQARTFAQLGISQRDLAKHGDDLQWVIGRVADGLAEMPAGTDKAAISARLFGRTWTALAPLVRSGSRELQTQLELADKYGATLGGKTVRDVQKLLQAQREQRLAWMGIQVQLGQALIPIVQKASAYFSEFVHEMRTGEGVGGDFMRAARVTAHHVRHLAESVARVTAKVVEFVGEHPLLAKTLGVFIAIEGVAKGIKFASAITGIKAMTEAAHRLGRTKAGTAAVSSIVEQLSLLPLRGRLAMSTARDWLARVSKRSGAAAGEAAAANMAGSLASQLPASMGKREGRIKGAFGRWGRVAGIAFGAAFLLMVPELVKAVSTKLQEAFPFLSRYSGSKGWGNLGKDALKTFFLPERLGLKGVKKLFGGRSGGMVPALVSSGEEVHYGDASWTVPGSRVAADNVLTMLPVGSAVVTSDGQAKMRAGASLVQALASQAPHFGGGGVVRGKVSVFGPPLEGAGTTASGGSSSQAGLAMNLQPGTDSGWNNPTTDRWMSMARSGRPQLFEVRIAGHRGVLPAIDKGPAGFTNRAIDVTGAGARRMGIDPARFPTDATGTATAVGKSAHGALNFMRQPAVLRARLVDIQQPYGALDAFQQGFDVGVGGGRLFRTPTGLDSDLFKSAIGGVRPNTRDVPHRVKLKLGELRGVVAGIGGVPKSFPDASGARPGLDALAWVLQRKFGLSLASGKNDHSKYTTTGNISDHWYGSAIDVSNGSSPTPQMDAAHGWLQSALGPAIKQMLYRTMVGGNHFNHIHVALKDYFADNPGAVFRLMARGGQRMRRGGMAGGFVKQPARRGGAAVQRFQTGGRVGRLVSSIGSAGVRDSPTVVLQMRRLASTLDNAEWIAYRRLGRIDDNIRRDIAGLARGGLTGTERVQVRRLRGALTLVEATMGRQLGMTVAASQRVLDAVSTNQTLVGRGLAIKGIDESSVQGLTTLTALDRNSLAAMRGERGGLRRALRRAVRRNQPEVASSIRQQLGTLEDTIGETRVSRAERRRALATMRRYQPIDVDLARAGLTDDQGDDLAALRRREAFQTQDFQRARTPEETIRLAGELASTREAIKSLEQAQREAARTARYQPGEVRQAMAQLTSDTSDDLAALREREALLAEDLARAANPEEAIGLANELASTREAIESMARAARYQPGEVRMALAGLTRDTGDDLVALREREALLAEDLARAADPEEIINLANELSQTRSSIESLTQEQAEANRLAQERMDLDRQLAENQRRIIAVAESQPNVLLGALVAAINGDIGGKVGLGFQTPMFPGRGVKYLPTLG